MNTTESTTQPETQSPEVIQGPTFIAPDPVEPSESFVTEDEPVKMILPATKMQLALPFLLAAAVMTFMVIWKVTHAVSFLSVIQREGFLFFLMLLHALYITSITYVRNPFYSRSRDSLLLGSIVSPITEFTFKWAGFIGFLILSLVSLYFY